MYHFLFIYVVIKQYLFHWIVTQLMLIVNENVNYTRLGDSYKRVTAEGSHSLLSYLQQN